MYCSQCGAHIVQNARYCASCGHLVHSNVPEVVYVEEKQEESILDNKAVVALTFCILVLSIITIVCTSLITKDIPTMNRLDSIVEKDFY